MEFTINELQIINRSLLVLREEIKKNYDNEKYTNFTDREMLDRKYYLFREIMKVEDIMEKIDNYFQYYKN